ncbi:hypothetical protein MBLNU457_4453t1 [Dothideomycetes sp. NU457]
MGNNSGKPVVFTDEVNLDHFRLLRVVGKGAFGKVRIVERKDTGLTFALKYIRKDEVVRSESVRNMIRERRMLEHLNHPFLCNLRYSFQDVEYLYIVVDLMTGGDLRFHITRKAFTEEAIRFWIAELGCALRYIHQQGIVHRDVKPDNVLLDNEGHVHLADFNVATDLTPGRPLTSKSGTLAYLAPEVYRGKGYGPERPFEGNHHEQLAQAIMKGDPNYPVTNPPVSMVCMHAISSLLEKDKSLRIGASSWDSFIDNPFFRELDFDLLLKKQIEPVFVPSSEKTNFDATYDLEELLLEEAPLEARTRKQKPRAELRPDASDAEIRADELHRMIETLFEPFNYTLLPEHRNPVTADEEAQKTLAKVSAADVKGNLETNDDRLGRNQSPIPVRSQTSRSARSETQSPSGSPPVPSNIPTPQGARGDYFGGSQPPTSNPDPSKVRSVRYDDAMQSQQPKLEATSSRKPRGSTRTTSMSGSGVQVVLNETGSWSDMANQSQRMVHEESNSEKKPNGMLGFLSRKKGRDRSPKAREKGVLGKEGARVIVGG